MKTRIDIVGLARRWRIRKVAICLIPALLFYMLFLNYTEPTELGIARNRVSGQMWAQQVGGWHLTPPWVSVAIIDTRPVRVAVTTAGHGYSAKLVQFNPDAWKEFVEIEGFHYYWWANRFSFNLGYDEEYRGMRDILRGHAYTKKQYTFIKVITEYQ